MSTFPGGSITGCPDMQAALNTHFRTCDAQGLVEPAPYVEFLFSQLNRQGVEQIQSSINPGPGKLRTLQLVYMQRLSESVVEVNDSCDFTCTATNTIGDGVAEYQIDPCDSLEYSIQLNAQDFRASCRSNGAYAMDRIKLVMDVVARATATKLTNKMMAFYGNWASNVTGTITNKILTLNVGAITAPNPTALIKLKTALMKTGYCAPPVIFAAETMYNYAGALSVGCCASSGLDLRETLNKYGQAVVYDMRVENAGDASTAIVVQPGAHQAIYFDKYAGAKAMNNDIGVGLGATNYETYTVFHPRLGLPMNILINDTCGVVSIVVSTNIDVVTMPTDMFGAGDRMNGVVFTNRLNVQAS